MVFRKVVLFLTALLAVLYGLALLHHSTSFVPLADYWMPRRSQMPGFLVRDTLLDLKLDDADLERLAQVDALAESLDEEIVQVAPELPKPSTVKSKTESPSIQKPSDRVEVAEQPVTKKETPAGEKTSKEKTVTAERKEPVQKLEFGEEGYEKLIGFCKHIRSIETEGAEVRILHYGDSQIEGDRVSSYLRSRLQKEFGGAGVGYIPPVPPLYPPYGLTVKATRPWHFYSIMPAHRRKKELTYGVLGSVCRFDTEGSQTELSKVSAEVNVVRNPKAGRGMQFQHCKVLFSNPQAACKIGVYVNDSTETMLTFDASPQLQQAILPLPPSAEKFKLQFSALETPNIYGISFDTGAGIQVDNVPLRGSGGTDFVAISDTMFREVERVLSPKLVLLQFGVNVVPSQLSSYGHYSRQLQAQIERLKELLPSAAFVLLGVSDMGLKEEESFHSYPNVGLVRNAQRNAALRAGIAFWDSYAAMGGANAIIRWVNSNLATSDYVHFTPRGARFLAEMFCSALLDFYANPEIYATQVLPQQLETH